MGTDKTRELVTHRAPPPVTMLPNEIVVEIIRLASAKGESWRDMVVVNRLMGVCRYWKDVVVNTPLLWSSIDLSKAVHFVRLCLARSAGAEIGLYDTRSMKNTSALVSLLEPHCAQVSYVDLSLFSDGDVAAFLPILTASLPRLMSLSLAMTSQHFLTPVLSFCLVAFFDMLEACKSLQHFSWQYDDFYDNLFCDHEHGEAADRIVSLRHSRSFHSNGLPADISNVTTHVSLSRYTRLSLEIIVYSPWYVEDPTLPSPSELEVRRQIPSFRTILLPNPKLNHPAFTRTLRHAIAWVEENLIVCADEERTLFWESLPWRSPKFHWTSDVFPEAPLLYMVYGVLDGILDDSESGRVFDRVLCELGGFLGCSVETLVVHGGHTHTQELEMEHWIQMPHSLIEAHAPRHHTEPLRRRQFPSCSRTNRRRDPMRWFTEPLYAL
ncbi:uncharacterized protein B0H18DRAFT_1214019 [Fomitopsis serialis]|uniref:uncharacterized protein n=1 Tax=Fomitopsis serialis TaxID=139415 RepID=UPI002007D470|nr:uncharacterized protein B0H18DRAFT_1214019 [Neoantrodia serialis]KAH9919046.1 hypothetical protein B0H18DRAFT_1214019 [Neoantrodia serialis]